MKTLVFTCGDINGIGPEISIKAINKLFNPAKRKIIFICPASVFEKNISFIKPTFPFEIISRERIDTLSANVVSILDLSKTKLDFGRPTKYSGMTASKVIELSHRLVCQISNSAIVTAPISKRAFEMAGVKYQGQTEYFASLSKSEKFMMVFLSRKMICGLATIHIPLKEVSSSLSIDLLQEKIEIFSQSLQNDLGKFNPSIAVLGLNPHSGEEGRIGSEEIDVIKPAIIKTKKLNAVGPFVPDAFFGTKQFREFDGTIGLYHDQVLIPFKMLNFERGVNFTAGLDIIRTSPDHGTAYDIAGLGVANPASMIEAAIWAEKIISNRIKANAR
ncbi:MAG: 4-hydroxythreonine-4-phosphate dehydrogenase PdxA [Melioribacteraceae bacterium]